MSYVCVHDYIVGRCALGCRFISHWMIQRAPTPIWWRVRERETGLIHRLRHLIVRYSDRRQPKHKEGTI